eukprot:TRINITY_DN6835_c1_g1_i2.p2 TRINITY_DN6835_c1_g1~~TRINITY_DN6835_c1_g1_i2.p2  ORF type:complete len:276 (+),score=44.51 TRINITY_DN6835_c1_g1_i2:60-887(+)
MIQSKANNISSFVMESLSKMAMVMFLVSFAWSTFGQGWERTFGGDNEDYGFDVIQTNDRGFLIVGMSESFGDDNDADVYVVRTDADGTLLWEKVFDEGLAGFGSSVIETSDLGFLIGGQIMREFNEEPIPYLLKITEEGKFEWSRTYGDGTLNSQLRDVCALPGGGYALVGRVKAENGEDDILLIRTDEDGNAMWQKTIGGEKDDVGNAIVGLEDGMVIVGSIQNGTGADNDIYISRLDLEGNTIWADTTLQTNAGEDGNDLLLTQSGQMNKRKK